MTTTRASLSPFSGVKGAARSRPRVDPLDDATLYGRAALKPPWEALRLTCRRMQLVTPSDFTGIGCSITDISLPLLPSSEGELPMTLAGALLAIARTVPGVLGEELIPADVGPHSTTGSLIVEATL